MKLSKVLSVAAAAAVASSMCAVASSAEEGTYHAYLGIQSASFTFRNAWNEQSYGQGVTSDSGMVYFDTLTGWDAENNAVDMGGDFTDAEITGDGTYSVSLTGDFDFGSDESLNLLFVSTDIPLDAGVTISDVHIILDGNDKYTFDEAYLSPDETTYLQPMAINIWNSDLGAADGLFGYTMPTSSVEVTFTVSGMGDAAAASEEAPAEEEAAEETAAEETTDAPASDDTTTAAATGNASAAAIAAVVAAAGAAAVLARKRK